MIDTIKMLYLRYKELINYGVIGFLTTVVSLGSYYICVLTVFDPNDALLLQTANVISWVCAVAFAYLTNKKYVFESKESYKLRELVKFVGARISTLLIDMACMAIFVSVFGMNDKWAKISVQFIVFLLNYIFSKFFVFIGD